MEKLMNDDQFEEAMDNGDLDEQYAEFIMENSRGDRIISNGNSLVIAIENGYMYEQFRDFMTKETQ